MRTLEELKSLLPKETYLIHVDYNDSFDEQLELLETAIQLGNCDEIYEKIDEWCNESESESISNYVDNLNLTEEELEEYDDQLRDEVCGRNQSDVLADLLKNTSSQTMFYDTSYDVPSESWSWDEKRLGKEINEVKKVLKIKLNDYTWDEEIKEMILEASYGGDLVIYFYSKVDDYITSKHHSLINFENAYIAVINTHNGSGGSTHLENSKFSFPYNRKNLFLCGTFKYSYTFSVCGMYDDWCKDTSVELSTKTTRRTIKVSDLSSYKDQENKYNITFKAGGCTFGDMDINRHKNTPYTNDFPAGNRCTNCGTFWID